MKNLYKYIIKKEQTQGKFRELNFFSSVVKCVVSDVKNNTVLMI